MGQELTKIEGDEIVIRVKINAIPHAASVAWDEEYGEHGITVEDAAVFAEEVVSELCAEDEDGTTLVDRMLDNACVNAAENGAQGLSE